MHKGQTNAGSFHKNRTAHNKGKRDPQVMKRIQSVKNHLPLECKTHGEHLEWKLCFHSDGYEYPKCILCQKEYSKKAYHENADMWNRRKRQWERDNPLKQLLQTARRHARKADREFNIDLSYLERLIQEQDNRCVLSGAEFNKKCKPSLDRKNSSKGYVKGNVQLVTIDVNYAKQSLTNDEFVRMCCDVSRNNKQHNPTNMQAMVKTILSV